MKVYTLSRCTSFDGNALIGIYQYLSQAQEAAYAYIISLPTTDRVWTEVREVTMGAAPEFNGSSFGLGVEVQ
jgi:hypothetical protein